MTPREAKAMPVFSSATGAVILLRFELAMGLFFAGLLWAVAAALAADLTGRPRFLVVSMAFVLASGVAGPFAFHELWRIFALELMVVMMLLTFGLAWRIGTIGETVAVTTRFNT